MDPPFQNHLQVWNCCIQAGKEKTNTGVAASLRLPKPTVGSGAVVENLRAELKAGFEGLQMSRSEWRGRLPIRFRKPPENSAARSTGRFTRDLPNERTAKSAVHVSMYSDRQSLSRAVAIER